MRRFVAFVVVVMLIALAAPAFAQVGNGAFSGPHFNLNIIGVEKGKTAPMTNTDRHTIFVALGSNDTQVITNIYLKPSADFMVCDGNGFDAAYDCNGQAIGTKKGATFALPCNTNLPNDYELIACSGENPTASYYVYARGLGKPGGKATMTTCATDPSTGETVCSTENTLEALWRDTGKSIFKDVTHELTSIVADIDGDDVMERVALFEGGLEDWYWEYANKGLRLAQLRFYLTD